MNRAYPKLVTDDTAPAAPPLDQRLVLGRFSGLDGAGRPLVRVGTAEPVLARCAAAVPAGFDPAGGEPASVLLFLEDGDPQRPIITGFVADTLQPTRTLLDSVIAPSGATVDGKRLQFEAREEVVLKCGKGSITLQANGRVVIKGTELVSTAAATNKIRGASVSIN